MERAHNPCNIHVNYKVILFSGLNIKNMATGASALSNVKSFFGKYFMVDQALHTPKTFDESASFVDRNRKFLSVFLPFVVVQTIWWTYMSVNDKFHIFNDHLGKHDNEMYWLTVTMVFGSMLAGSTSEGGAAVAFPVLTLVFGVAPAIARDFSYMIQSVGMTCAAFTIWFMGVKLEYRSVLYCTVGGAAGVIFGLEQVAPRLSPPYSKMYFVVIWFTFAMALFWLNFYHNRKVYHAIPYWDQGRFDFKDVANTFRNICNSVKTSLGLAAPPAPQDVSPSEGEDHKDEERNAEEVTSIDFTSEHLFTIGGIEVYMHWKAMLLLAGGFLGGIFSAIGGSGLDICSFAMLTLIFCVSERIATPTSVVLMAINTVVAFMWRLLYMKAIDDVCYDMWLSCIPVVVIGAPLGAVISSHWHRLVIAFLVVGTDVVQLIGALIVVRPWTTEKDPNPVALCTSSAVLLVAGIIFFTLMAFAGNFMIEWNNRYPIEIIDEQEKLYVEKSHGNVDGGEVTDEVEKPASTDLAVRDGDKSVEMSSV